MAEKVCKGDHGQHICTLARAGQFEKIKWMIIEPKFMCHNCGRASKKGENLCNPINVDMGKYM